MSNKAAFVVKIFPEIRLISEGYLLPRGKRESKDIQGGGPSVGI